MYDMTQTVEQVKKFLTDEFKKYNWGNAPPSLVNLLKMKTKKAFDVTKGHIGNYTILKFLGKTWKQSEIRFAIDQQYRHYV